MPLVNLAIKLTSVRITTNGTMVEVSNLKGIFVIAICRIFAASLSALLARAAYIYYVCQ